MMVSYAVLNSDGTLAKAGCCPAALAELQKDDASQTVVTALNREELEAKLNG